MLIKCDPESSFVPPLLSPTCLQIHQCCFKYNFCESDFVGGAPRIKSHLAGVKGRDIDLCTKVPEDIQVEAYLAIGGPSKKLKSASNLSNAEQIKTPTSMSNDLP